MLKKLIAIAAMTFFAASSWAVDVNKASAAELDAIKGIGPGISGKILDERKKGAFKDWNDLISRVNGVGDANAAKFSEGGMTVGGSAYKGAVAKKDDKPAAAAKKEEKPAAKAEEKKADAKPVAAKEEKKDPKADDKKKAEAEKKAKAAEEKKAKAEAKQKADAEKKAKTDAAKKDAKKDDKSAAAAPKKEEAKK